MPQLYHSTAPLRIYKNSAGYVTQAVKYARDSEHSELRPVLYITEHNASISTEQYEAIAREIDAALDRVLLGKDAPAPEGPFSSYDYDMIAAALDAFDPETSAGDARKSELLCWAQQMALEGRAHLMKRAMRIVLEISPDKSIAITDTPDVEVTIFEALLDDDGHDKDEPCASVIRKVPDADAEGETYDATKRVCETVVDAQRLDVLDRL